MKTQETKMSFKSIKRAVFAATIAITPLPALAGGIMIHDAYALSARPNAPTGAAFMSFMNMSGQDDRLVGVASDVAKMVELHTHVSDGNGIMKMTRIEGGVALPNGETYVMERGGDHVMFMGLNATLEHGDEISVTFTFEKAGEMVVAIPVDLERKGTGHGH
jgi:copper(I)-binding protein